MQSPNQNKQSKSKKNIIECGLEWYEKFPCMQECCELSHRVVV